MFITLFLVSVAMELGVFQSFSEILEPITTILGLESGITLLTSPRESILLGKILFISTIGLLQATVILLITAALGVRIHSPLNIVLVYVTLFLFGVLFSAIATTLALFISDHDGYAAMNSMISMPLFFAINALMPYDKMPEWLRLLAMVNPLSHTIDSIRLLFAGGLPVEGMVGLFVAAGIMVCGGIVQFRRTGV